MILYNLIDKIHRHETEAISDERKAEVIRDSWENEKRFDIPVESIVRSEWKKVRIIIAVWIGLAVLLTVLLIFNDNDAYQTFEILFMVLVSFLCVMEIPYELIRTIKKNAVLIS